MADLIFHAGPLPAGFAPDFEPAIFNLPEFNALQGSTTWLPFYLLDSSRNKAIASLLFHIEGTTARSPMKAPFGSVEGSTSLSPQMLFDFLEFVEKQLGVNGIREAHIKNPPRAYDPKHLAVLETILLNRKYVVAEAEVGAVIKINPGPLIEGVHSSEILRGRQARNAGLNFSLVSLEEFESVFNFIADCHRKKGYNLSISREGLQSAARKFPDRYVLFAIETGQTIVAASVSVLVKKNILYNFLVNHDEAYNQLSPPVLLIAGTYDYCREKGIALFDLGTSALDGGPNFSLLDFKLRMGGVPTSKFTFYKKLS